MTTITLTTEQREIVKAEMDNKIEMLSDEEIEVLATKLNEKINIPFIKEGTEQTIFVKIVKLVDRLLYQNLPNELYGLVKDTSDGISDEDAKELASVLGSRMNGKFDIPYLPEWVEQKLFVMLIELIVDAMRKNYSILVQPA
ncbi:MULTISPECIES: hypothetical protein [Pseudoalteromonas]|uniref:hypothetical protein n=1 Tax=Pseudoalteromonas TaxID=53246 RepID=UPI0015734841|nr:MULTISPECIES: hypothetical protein [Pseudoalteromonas]MBR8843059.1 hypothetical protein [Pseudoalteromonas sp. JC3]NSY33881.1 hypothetical protein [Pseudoalteromonas sp. JC28]QUI69035.1 hypothetical protein GSF13_04380 [Pseudoalteromonas sp. M8]UDM64269.1 hypothetical protein KIJ96_20025 [Pseudoalteromonas piscicida]WJE10752.1 hypothetical protein QSH61_21955 [Pseudoalteromonas sp. JC3]